jgi:hypothetical protein
MTGPVRARRAGMTLGLVAILVASGRTVVALAADTSVPPVPPRSDIVFFVRENDVRKVPAPGVVVTITVTAGNGDGATVTPTDRAGTATRPPAGSAANTTDRLGNAYFRLHTSTKVGLNTFLWGDGHGHDGRVNVSVSASATPAPGGAQASAVAGSPTLPGNGSLGTAGTTVATGRGLASPAPPWRALSTALAAVVLAGAGLFWTPRILRRRASRRSTGED